MPVGGTGVVLVEVLVVLLWLAAAVTTGLKGKWASLVVGLVFWPVLVVAAVRMARLGSKWAYWLYTDEKVAHARARTESRRYRALVVAGWLLSLAFVGTLFGLFKAYRIPSSSMEPTLHCPKPAPACTADEADRVLVLRSVFAGDPARGALIAYRAPAEAAARCSSGGTFLHRVVGLPGERVALQDGILIVDGKPLEEPYVPEQASTSETRRPVRVPSDQYFVLGDNRTRSCDSRLWGTVPRSRIVGRVIFRYWPPNRWGAP